MRINEISPTDTHALRRAVLRDNDPTRPVHFPEDEAEDTVHLGVFDDDGALVATSSWAVKECPHFPGRRAVQLRGMATATAVQGKGAGGMLIESAAARYTAAGFELMWARARDSALGFYAHHDCRVVGDGFIDDTTRLPHHVVVRDLG
ncbi:MAG TPA: GNAT family N-acetyltransferase [Ilumatobacteraceae bacterium]|jgi:GNAT superfamily N-acetyltransferase